MFGRRLAAMLAIYTAKGVTPEVISQGIYITSLLAFTANSAAQSSAQTDIHSAIVVIDTSNNA